MPFSILKSCPFLLVRVPINLRAPLLQWFLRHCLVSSRVLYEKSCINNHEQAYISVLCNQEIITRICSLIWLDAHCRSCLETGFMIQGRRNDFQSRGAWSQRSEISSGRNSETCYSLEKSGGLVLPRLPCVGGLKHS